jgi:hypothetical protein
MSFLAGEITVRCPRCGWPVRMQVLVSSVAGWEPGSTGNTCLRVQLEDARTDTHVCGPPQGDGLKATDRFVKSGALDDQTLLSWNGHPVGTP